MKKNTRFALFGLLLFFFFLEASSFAALLILKKIKHVEYTPKMLSLAPAQKELIEKIIHHETAYIKHDSVLGWTIAPGGQKGLYRANAQGIRANKAYAPNPPRGIVRIATFGDSFTHGDEVPNEQTWQHFMEKNNTSLEVMNFGVGAYGVDQAYLRYLHEGRKFNPDIVIISFLSDDYYRHGNVFRPFVNPGTNLPLAKPRFKVKANKLTLIENPLPSLNDYEKLLANESSVLPTLGKNDYYYPQQPIPQWNDIFATVRLLRLLVRNQARNAPPLLVNDVFNAESEIFLVTDKIMEAFYQQVLKDGATPIIVVLPNYLLLKLNKKTGVKFHASLLERWQSKGYRYLDLTDPFQEKYPDSARKAFSEGRHYSSQGNAAVARFLLDYLKNSNLVGSSR